MTAKQKRMLDLIQVLNRARKAYYEDKTELMSNYEYDKLEAELEALERETGTILANSPTQQVGYEVVSKLPKEAHAVPALSLDKTKEVDRLVEFLGDREGVLSWKLDGLTVVLTYEDGKLAKAVTRGNGQIGEVITPNAKTFVNVPLTIPFKDPLVIRGEALITYEDFERINQELPEGRSLIRIRETYVPDLSVSWTAGSRQSEVSGFLPLPWSITKRRPLSPVPHS